MENHIYIIIKVLIKNDLEIDCKDIYYSGIKSRMNDIDFKEISASDLIPLIKERNYGLNISYATASNIKSKLSINK